MTIGRALRIGLTGGIASGKSTVSEMLRQLGAVVIDTDQIAREVVQPGSPAVQALHERYGDAILHPDGALRRERLGEIVFASPEEKNWLEQLLHPLIKKRAEELAQQAADAEMRQQLNEIAAQVDAWKQGTITGRELRSVLHAYADGASRELIRKYRETPDDQLVAEALANGILKREETPRDALRFLEQDDDAAA